MSDHSIHLLGNGKKKKKKEREGFVKRGDKLQSSMVSTNSQENSIDRCAQSPSEKNHSHPTDTEHGKGVIWNKIREELERKDDDA